MRSAIVSIIVGLLIAPISMPGAVPTTVSAKPEWHMLTATSADAFIESAGINVHMNNVDTGYGDESMTLALLQNLGVRHVRDGLQPDDAGVFKALRLFRDAGIKSVLIAGGSFDQPDSAETIAGGIAALADPNKLLGVATGIEGTNEPDCDRLLEDTKQRQNDLAAAVKAEPALAGVPVLTPGWCRRSESIADYGNDGAASDLWNIHPYPGENMPEAGLSDSRPDFENTAEGQITEARNTKDQPAWATETGYNNALNNPDVGAIPISEKAASSYIPRIFLENYRLGIDRSYLYELFDERPDPALKDAEQSFGLVRYDGTLKPAYDSLQSLFTTLADPGSMAAARSIRLGFENAPADLRQMAFTRSDGSIDLVLWRATSVWNTKTDADIKAKTASIKLLTGSGTPASVVKIAYGTARTSLGTSDTFTLKVGPFPIIVRLGQSAGTPAVQQRPLPDREPSSLTSPGKPTAKTTCSHSTRLTWAESTGDRGVNTYVVLRDGQAIARTTEPKFKDTTLKPGTTYSYQIRAIDEVGGNTALSAATKVTTRSAKLKP